MGQDLLPRLELRLRYLHGLIRIRITNQADTLSYWPVIRACYNPPLPRYRIVALAKSSPCSNAGGSATLPLVIASSGDRHRTATQIMVTFTARPLYNPAATWQPSSMKVDGVRVWFNSSQGLHLHRVGRYGTQEFYSWSQDRIPNYI